MLTHACQGAAVCPTSLTRHAGHLTYPKQRGQYKEQQQQKMLQKMNKISNPDPAPFSLAVHVLDRILLLIQKPMKFGLKTFTLVLNLV